jgi:hypothetical protein
LADLPVAFGAELINLGLHPGQQLFGGFRRNACSLKRLNIFPLPVDVKILRRAQND